jgi:hypothetical protein
MFRPTGYKNTRVHSCLGYLDNWHGITVTEWRDLDVNYVPAYCLHESVTIRMADGSVKHVTELCVGDEVATLDGRNTTTIAARVRFRKRARQGLDRANHAEREKSAFDFVRVGSTVLTKGHPILIEEGNVKKWRRPEELAGSIQFSDHVREVYNFVTVDRQSLVVNDGVIVATLGQFCDGVDTEDSFFGTDRVIRYLESQSDWPDVTLLDA